MRAWEQDLARLTAGEDVVLNGSRLKPVLAFLPYTPVVAFLAAVTIMNGHPWAWVWGPLLVVFLGVPGVWVIRPMRVSITERSVIVHLPFHAVHTDIADIEFFCSLPFERGPSQVAFKYRDPRRSLFGYGGLGPFLAPPIRRLAAALNMRFGMTAPEDS